MGKMICLMGKSSSGKDTIYKHLMEDPRLSLRPIVPYTTRPIRAGEQNGVEYFLRMRQGFTGCSRRAGLSRREPTGRFMDYGDILPLRTNSLT